MSKSFPLRLTYLALLFLGVWWLPPWALAGFFLVAIFRWPSFYEALLPALLFDLTWGLPEAAGWSFPFAATVLTLVAVYLTAELKPSLIWRS
jgi:hypothetical protein